MAEDEYRTFPILKVAYDQRLVMRWIRIKAAVLRAFRLK